MTHTKDEALDLAQKALIYWQGEDASHTEQHAAYHAIKQARSAPVQDLPFGVGGGLVAIKTLLSRDPCVHANTAIEMIDAILKEHPAAQPAVPLTDEQKRDLIKKSALWDMHIHIGWYSAPAKSFVEKTIQLIADIEAAHGITKGQS